MKFHKLYKYLMLLIVLTSSNILYSQVNFPIRESFMGNSVPTNWQAFRPTGTTNASAAIATSSGFRLTNSTGQFGSIVLTGASYNFTNGFEVEFEFSLVNGVNNYGYWGDGFTFFLFDGSVITSNSGFLGTNGRGLGYTRGASQEGNNGLDGAYIGIGFDAFGNFKTYANPRNGFRSNDDEVSFSGDRGKNHITLRGGAPKNDNIYDRSSGYPVLYTVNTSESIPTSPSESNRISAILNDNGKYVYSSTRNFSNSFLLRSGETPLVTPTPPGGSPLHLPPTDEYFKKAKIIFVPHALGGYKISIIVFDGGIEYKVLENFHYKTGTLRYIDGQYNSTSVSTNNTLNNPNNTVGTATMTSSVPNTFKMGFAGATGGASLEQYIRKVVINLPFMHIAEEDYKKVCSYHPMLIEISPFTNDQFSKGALTADNIPRGNDNTFIDYSSFQFSDENDNPIGNQGANYKQYTDPSKGIWSYNQSTGIVTFKPNFGFTGTAEIYYTAKGFGDIVSNVNNSPFGQEIYRSEPSKITAEVLACGSVINPQLPSGGVSRSGK